MPYESFHELFPEIAERETRTITIFEHSDLGVPPGHYSFIEMFCNEPGCDCRRVFFYVVSPPRKDVVAVIAWGWENEDFYAKWMKDDDPEVLAELKGPILNLGSPQSNLAPAVLELTRRVLLRDKAYIERIKGHYRIFREKIDGKLTPKPKKGGKKRKKRMR